MNMIEAMTGAANAPDEVVEQPYEKSGAFIGGLAGVVAGWEDKKIPDSEMREVAVRDLEQLRKSTHEMIASFQGTYKMMLASEVWEARLPSWG